MDNFDKVISLIVGKYGELPKKRQEFFLAFSEHTNNWRDIIVSNLNLQYEDLDSFCAACIRSLSIRGERQIGFFYHPHAWSHIGEELLEQLREMSFVTVFLMLSDGKKWKPWCLPVDRALLRKLDSLSLIIGTSLPSWVTLSKESPRDVPVLNINRTARTFLNPLNKSRLDALQMFRWGDYVAIPVKHAQKAPKNLIVDEILLPKKIVEVRRRTYVLPLVPGKIDRIARNMESASKDRMRSILICPSVSNLPAYMVKEYGLALVNELLTRYPQYNVVFRPRPEDANNSEVKEIVDECKGMERFIFDESHDVSDLYSSGILLITDRSSTGQTFALSTGQPSISFPLDNKFDGITLQELKGKACFKVESFNELLQKIDELIGNIDSYRKSVLEVRDSVYAGNFSFSRKMAGYIESIANREVSSDWFSIEIASNSIVNDDLDGCERSLLSIIEKKWGLLDIYGLGISGMYLEELVANNEPAPDHVLFAIEDEYLRHFLSGHSLYSVLRPLVRMVFHNLKLNVTSQQTLSTFKRCAQAVLNRGLSEAINAFDEEGRVWLGDKRFNEIMKLSGVC